MRRVLQILGALQEQDVSWLIKAGSRRELPPGEDLVTRGTKPEAVFIVGSGSLKVWSGAQGAPEIARLTDGEIIGEISLLDPRPPLTTVTALEPVVLLELPRARLDEKLQGDPRFAARFYRALGMFLAQRLRNTTSQMGLAEPIDDDDPDELQFDALEETGLASRRFKMILDTLQRTRRAG